MFDDIVFNQFRSYFAQEATATVCVNRDLQDNYHIQIIPQGKSVLSDLTKIDIVSLLPIGSQWLQSVGWHSYVGIPFKFNRRDWLALGVELVKTHPTRGAYISFLAYLFPFNSIPIEQLKKFVNDLTKRHLRLDVTTPNKIQSIRAKMDYLTNKIHQCNKFKSQNEILNVSSKNPNDHIVTEAKIILQAIESYKKRDLLLFRTLILSKSQFPVSPSAINKEKSVDKLQVFYYKYLVATVPSIKQTFSY